MLQLRLQLVKSEGRELSESELQALSQRLERQTSNSDVLHQTVANKLLGLLRAPGFSAKIDGMESMGFMQKEIAQLIEELDSLVDRDLQLHASRYRQIVEEQGVNEEKAVPASGSTKCTELFPRV